eukprot:218231_1
MSLSLKFLKQFRSARFKGYQNYLRCVSIRRFHPNQNVFTKQNYNNYDEFYSSFQWNIPKYFNIGYACCDYHVDTGNGNKVALYDYSHSTEYTYNDLYTASNKLCNALQQYNINIGDRIGILLPQTFECSVSHFATYKLGCISLPLFILFGTDSLLYRLHDSQCKILITNESCLETILSIKHELPYLQHIIVTGNNIKNDKYILSFNTLLDNASSQFNCINTTCDDPAIIIYTSGTTGNAKGCLHAHRVLLGRLPGIEVPQQFNSIQNKMFWTPADFAWIGGLLAGLMPSLYYGVPVVCYSRSKFDAEEAFWLMKHFGITTTFLPPTALKVMKQFTDNTGFHEQYYHKMLNLSSGGEYLGEHLHEWGRQHFGVEINEFYSQTECSVIISNAPHIFQNKSGSMGKTVPGHIVEIIDENGNIINDSNKIGVIGVQSPDPVMFLNYWNDEKRTKEKFIVNEESNIKWLITGDLAKKDKNGYFYYYSRSDDVIISAGYRIGPSEIENVCMKHELIANCAVIGVPDDLRNEIVKLFVVLKNKIDDVDKLNELKIEIQNFTKEHVGRHEYPRIIEFVDDLPMTISKKIQRHKLREIEAKNVMRH